MSKMTKICPCQNTEEETFEAMFAPVRIGVHFRILCLFGGSLNARIYYSSLSKMLKICPGQNVRRNPRVEPDEFAIENY